MNLRNKANKIETTVKIYGYLRDHANKWIKAKDIAAACDVSIRTFYRYIVWIVYCDYNVLSEPGRNGGYIYVE